MTGKVPSDADRANEISARRSEGQPDLGGPTPPRQGHPAADAVCGDFDIRIGHDGTWYYHGSPIGRKPLVRLFASVLRREADGSFWLVTPVERGRIVVDDAPFVALEVSARGAGREQVLRFRTNIEDEVEAGPEHPIRVVDDPETGAPHPYILVRDGLEARLSRPVFYELAALAQPATAKDDTYGVWSNQTFFPLGQVKDEG